MEKYRYSVQERSILERQRQPFAIYQLIDNRVVALVLSDGFCRLFGYEDRGQAYFDMDNDMYKDTHPDDAGRIAAAAARFSAEDGKYEVIYRTKTRKGSEYRIIHAYGEHVYTDTGVRLAHVWYADEGIYKEEPARQGLELNQSLSNALKENSIVKASRYDYLTGLPSMTYFFELAEADQENARKTGEKPVTMYMDFIGMKYYNAKFGFAEGDRLLQSFAKILAETFGMEHCCRMGADHFAVQTAEAGMENKLRQVFLEFREANGGTTLPVHVGVYAEQLEKVHASVACDRAKLACRVLRGRYETAVKYYSRDLSKDAVKKQYIIENIDRAIAEKWIQVYYQPIVRAINGLACDVEALARWNDPEEGILSPADFVPYLEEAGLIYKLDLFVLDQVLIKMNRVTGDGLLVVPHSINLSRSDFDACDIVEEIRKRVDAARVSRSKISIEITESVIGGDFDFMREQVERFRSLGFPVWMDDFGSGYSSLDVLQSIKFDLLKFDMGFMRKLDEGGKGKIILTELMKMATLLGVDTICEGVETAEQVRFLQEIGCSKLQGYYFSKPVSYQTILDRRKEGHSLLPENPEEAAYYGSIGRVNLYDLDVMTSVKDSALQNSFHSVPMGILEINRDYSQYVRSNPSYRDFMKRYFGFDIAKDQMDMHAPPAGYSPVFLNSVRQCCDTGNIMFFDERLPDGSKAHAFVRRIGINPVSGNVAVAIAVLSISDPDQGESYADIAMALAVDYYNIFVIDLDTDAYIEYSSQGSGEELSVIRRGEGFFESARRDTMTRIYQEDREPFLALFTKENVLKDLDRQGVFTTSYRMIDTGTPTYVNMKITRIHGGNRIILGISIIEEQMRQKEEFEKAREQSIIFGRIAALSGKLFALYTVDPETGKYSEYNVTSGYGSLGFDKNGENFFSKGRSDGEKMVYYEDLLYFQEHFSKESIMRGVRERGVFQIQYRLMINGEPKPIVLKAAMVRESGGEKLIVGVNIVDE
ncbi:MAG: EAL domain-containing protein [Clostridia bacterium]|nr:EAL domain-containing protein [Clostridia bacterium]